MASKTSSSSLALFLVVNLLFFALVSACGSCPSPKPRPRPRPSPRPSPTPSPGGGGTPSPGGGGTPSPGGGGTTPSPATGGRCPRDAVKIGICANVLNGLVNATVGNPPVTPCCTLIQGLADLEAAVCLCTAIRASILGINLNLPINLSLLLNVCSRNTPSGFQCP